MAKFIPPCIQSFFIAKLWHFLWISTVFCESIRTFGSHTESLSTLSAVRHKWSSRKKIIIVIIQLCEDVRRNTIPKCLFFVCHCNVSGLSQKKKKRKTSKTPNFHASTNIVVICRERSTTNRQRLLRVVVISICSHNDFWYYKPEQVDCTLHLGKVRNMQNVEIESTILMQANAEMSKRKNVCPDEFSLSIRERLLAIFDFHVAKS